MFESGIRSLAASIASDFREMLGINSYGIFISREKREERVRNRETLRGALRKCGSGDPGSKRFVMDNIIDLLLTKYDIREKEADELIVITSTESKFLFMLYQYKRRYGEEGFERLMHTYGLAEGSYEISAEKIERAFARFPYMRMNFPEKIEYIASCIYAAYKGNGICDLLLESRLDGVSGGVSGGEKCVHVMFEGRTVRIPFLVFSPESELIRICKNICRTNGMGQLDEKKGYQITEMSDGSRAAVARPPFSESWAFFVRSFKNTENKGIEELITGEGSKEMIRLLRYIIRGNTVCAITGEMGSGKTTLLAALIGFVNEGMNIRVSETSSELHLRDRYPERNIIAFRETEQVKVQDTLDFAKKTDGTVTILGEAATMESVSYLVQLTQTASAFTLFTHHALTTEKLLYYIRNSLLAKGGFNNEQIAMEQAIYSVQMDIHMAKDPDGRRYIERITEIVPFTDTNGKTDFYTRDLYRYDGKAYVPGEALSEESLRRISCKLDDGLALEFASDARRWWKIRGKNIV